MLYEHTDLLSYDDIDKDVDGIFRAFCDTTLIEYAKDGAQNTPAFWANVVNFRRKNLCPYDRPDFLERASKAEPPPPEDGERLTNEDFERTRGFLYWFDVRAEYWSRNGANQKLVDTLVPAPELQELYHHAVAVQQRIHTQLPEASDNGDAWPRNTVIERFAPKPGPAKAAAAPEAEEEEAAEPDSARKKPSKRPPR
jgi:hypothetical protein